ncbi:MAG TPA: hypothetical protein PLK20_05675 [Paludibacteraceae bacterium]|nr:hypothetical protein [Paludibacteraceae bacterium]
MKILIACEYSGITRDAFAAMGHNAWSCDILPSETPGNHYQSDVREVLNLGWDMMIAHPPCTYLSCAGLHYCDTAKHGEKAIQRIAKRDDAVSFFLDLYNAPIHRICIENPQGYMSKVFRRPDQVIHPYYFGEREMKRTCLWLRNLPPLLWAAQNTLFETATATPKPEPYQIQVHKVTGKIKNRYWTDCSNSENYLNAHNRSKTFKSIANAMATQWG